MNEVLRSFDEVEFACKLPVVRRHCLSSSGLHLSVYIPSEALCSSVKLFAFESLPVTLANVCVLRLLVSVRVQGCGPASSCPTERECGLIRRLEVRASSRGSAPDSTLKPRCPCSSTALHAGHPAASPSLQSLYEISSN